MGQFDWLSRIGASDRAVAVLNDQPQLFTTLILVVVGLIAEGLFIWFIHFATRKSGQKKKTKTKKWWRRNTDDNKRSGAGNGKGRK